MRIHAFRGLLVCVAAIFLPSSPPNNSAQITIRYTKPRLVNRLSAKLVDPDARPISGASVEETGSDWKQTLRTTQTDEAGAFALKPVRGQKIYYIRVTKMDFSPTEFVVKISWMGQKTLTVTMELGS
jgi:hypothetical protein